MCGTYKKESVVVVMESSPVSLNDFCGIRGSLLYGWCEETKIHMLLKKSVGGKWYHIDCEYTLPLTWFKSLEDDKGLRGCYKDKLSVGEYVCGSFHGK